MAQLSLSTACGVHGVDVCGREYTCLSAMCGMWYGCGVSGRWHMAPPAHPLQSTGCWYGVFGRWCTSLRIQCVKVCVVLVWGLLKDGTAPSERSVWCAWSGCGRWYTRLDLMAKGVLRKGVVWVRAVR